MTKKKVDPKHEVYKSRGMKSGKQAVGSMESMKLSEGSLECADGNDGSKASAKKPENSHKLLKHS